jgi:hypothetical protein
MRSSLINQINMKKQFFKLGLPVLAALSPLSVFAAGKTLRDIIQMIIGYFSVFMVLIIGLAVLTFVWNIYKYFFRPEQDRKEAGMYVLFSTIGFFVILSFWGLVNILTNTLNLDNSAPTWWPFTSGGGGSYNSSIFNGETPEDGRIYGGGGFTNTNNGGTGYTNSNNGGTGFTNTNTGGSGFTNYNGTYSNDFQSTNDTANENEMMIPSDQPAQSGFTPPPSYSGTKPSTINEGI